MGLLKIQADVNALVEIEVKDGSDAITRVTGPGGDEWRASLYPLFTEDDVIEMWADNCVRNGVEDAKRLDGWADLESGEVTMRVTDASLDGFLAQEHGVER